MLRFVSDFGAWSLLPPALAIVFAVATKRVYQALTLGIVVAGIMVAFDAAGHAGQTGLSQVLASLGGGFMESVSFLVDGVADSGHAGIIAFTLFLGALVALMQKSGGIRGFGEAALQYADSRRKGQLVAWALGSLILTIDDYFDAIAVGTVMRPVTDKLRISREKLAYITDSIAAPVVILVPFSTWVGFIVSVIRDEVDRNHIEASAFEQFIAGIPFNLYALGSVLFVLLIALTGLDYGPMRRAEQRAAATGKVLADGAKPLMSREISEMQMVEGVTPRARNLILPIVFLIFSALSMLYATGHTPGLGFKESLYNSAPELSLAIATFVTLLFAMILYKAQGILDQEQYLETALDGFKAMIPALTILGLAWGIGNATQAVGLGSYLSGTVGDSISVAWVPLLAFILSGIIAFATGTSFGTFTIMLPVTISITAGTSAPLEWLPAVIAATVGGAVFGDHCSPISDTTVISSMASQSDHIDHVKTQLPYALSVAAFASAGYALLAVTGALWLAWLLALGMMALLFLTLRFTVGPLRV